MIMMNHMRNKIVLLVYEVMGEDDYDTGLGCEVIDDDNISMDYEVDENEYCHDSESLDDGCISSDDEGFEFENEDEDESIKNIYCYSDFIITNKLYNRFGYEIEWKPHPLMRMMILVSEINLIVVVMMKTMGVEKNVNLTFKFNCKRLKILVNGSIDF